MLLPIDWYYKEPIDFEHKQYLLLAYLQAADRSFMDKVVSPHLLHLERLRRELDGFKLNVEVLARDLHRHNYIFNDNPALKGMDNELLHVVRDVAEFSVLQIIPRINLGYKVLEKYRQLLF